MAKSSSDSPANSPITTTSTTTTHNEVPDISIEVVREEQMALIEAVFAMAAATRSSSLSPSAAISRFRRNIRSIDSISFHFQKRLSTCKENIDVDQSLLHRFRSNKGLSVTDFTATEWCEKQMEFVLKYGNPKETKAMKAGTARHAKLKAGFIKKGKIGVKSFEDIWALKFLNFIVGANQLLFEGLTRELPIIGFVEGVWMVGVIDEIQMSVNDFGKSLILVDTKTREKDTLPREPQRRNGRLQLMCYKYLWDDLVSGKFSPQNYYDYFDLNPHYILSEELLARVSKSGIPAKTLDDLVMYLKNLCNMLPIADNQLVLRYEHQKDYSLLGEDKFEYKYDWFKSKIDSGLQFWKGDREAKYTPDEERWKCLSCDFVSKCPTITSSSKTQPL